MKILKFVFMIFFTSIAFSQVNSINLQGVLKDSNGNKVNGTFAMTFNFYDSPDATQPIYAFTPASKITVKNGVFSIPVDFGTTDIFKNYQTVYLGVKVENEPEFPKIKIVSVAYAIHSKYADEVLNPVNDVACNGCIGTDEIADGSVTGVKLTDGAVTFSKISNNGCQAGEVMKFDGTSWNCSPDLQGAAVTNGTEGYVPVITADNGLANSNIFQNKTTKYIGIGTTGPLAPLHVNGPIVFENNWMLKVNEKNVITFEGPVGSPDNGIHIGGGGNVAFFADANNNQSNAAFYFMIGDSNNKVMKISNPGNIDLKNNFKAGGKITGHDVVALNSLCIGSDCRTSWPDAISGTGTVNYLTKWSSGDTITKSTVYDNGNVGIGTNSPVAKLDVAGEIKISSTNLACNSNTEGALRYNSSKKTIEVCDGTAWKVVYDPCDKNFKNCKDILVQGCSKGDGIYTIDPDGAGGKAPFDVYCDMTTDGGGWTIIANNDNSDSEASGCIPRVSAYDLDVCGSISVTSDFTVDASGIPFKEMVWATYSGSFSNIVAYQYFKWNTQITIPETSTWSLHADSYNQTLNGYSSKSKIYCTYSSYNKLEYIRLQTTNGGYTNRNTVFSVMDTSLEMSFTDYADFSTGQTKGLDDWQDGDGCSDEWQPKSYRGYSSYVMIR